ncbi:hypothetical protein L5515_012459 [Caenorhabditis briggsae]|uniref:Uncharacterized protein n=1 Tax=Caenorhabditis briggsae TaxID=6238 RepID=A0AAE9EYA2_CAEBR|nr:hypothetical protein L5515_012459 [Caenorhabditis briggsae]
MPQPYLRNNLSTNGLHLIERNIVEAEEKKRLATLNQKESIVMRNWLEISKKTICSRFAKSELEKEAADSHQEKH